MKLSEAIRQAADQCLATDANMGTRVNGKFTKVIRCWCTPNMIIGTMLTALKAGDLPDVETSYIADLEALWQESALTNFTNWNSAKLCYTYEQDLVLWHAIHYDNLQHIACYIEALEESNGAGFTGGYTGEDIVKSEGNLDIY